MPPIREYQMNKVVTCLLLACGFITSSYADNPSNHKVHNTIEFINNTNVTISIQNTIALDGLAECKDNPYQFCYKQFEIINVLPHSSREVSLETAVNDGHIHDGGVGMDVFMSDDNNKSNERHKIIVPATASPSGVVIKPALFGGSEVLSFAFEALPKYVVSLAQELTDKGATANRTVVSVNLLND